MAWLALLACLADPVVARVVPPAGHGGEGLPLCSGLFEAAPALAAGGGLIWLQDEAGQEAPAVFHRMEGRFLLHGVLPRGARGGRLRGSIGGPGPASWPRLSVSGGPDAYLLACQGFEVEAGPGMELHLEGWRIAVLPGSALPGRWSIRHHCPVRLDLLCENGPAEVGGGSLPATRLAVTLHAGLRRVDLALHLEAARRLTIPGGVGLEVGRGVPLVVELGEGTLLRGEEEKVAAVHDGEGWILPDGTRAPSEAGRAVVAKEAGRADFLAFSLPPGRGAAAENLILEANGGSLRLLWAGSQEVLEAGEGRILRGALAPGRRYPGGWPLVLPAALHFPHPLTPWIEDQGVPGELTRATRTLLQDFLLGKEDRGLIREGLEAGDWRMDARQVGNLEYDTTMGLLLWALAQGDVLAWHQAQAAADHLLGHDRDASGTGLFFQHGSRHRSGQVEAGHHWVEGLVLLDALEGDTIRGDILDRLLADQLRSLGALRLEGQHPRSLGWGLTALVAGAGRAADPRGYVREIKRWRRHLLSRRAPSGLMCLVPLDGAGSHHLVSTFVHGGILAPALARSLQVVPAPRLDDAVVLLGRALRRDAVQRTEEGWIIARELLLRGREGRSVRSSGVLPGEEAALFLSGLLVADPELRRDPILRRLGAELAGRLRSNRKRYVGRELSILLRALPGLPRW